MQMGFEGDRLCGSSLYADSLLPPTTAYIPPAPQTTAYTPPVGGGGSVTYSNCAEVRAAGAAPLYAGSPGYRPGLDRDGDGIACDT